MRRICAAVLLVLLVTQSSGAALATIESSQLIAEVGGGFDRYSSSHTRRPHFERPAAENAIRSDVSRERTSHAVRRAGVLLAVRYPARPPVERVKDPRAVRAAATEGGSLRPGLAPLHRNGPQSRPAQPGIKPEGTLDLGGTKAPGERRALKMAPQGVATSDAGAGINRYWEYEERAVPGVGKAMLNVGTGNLLLQATDVDISERGLDLVIQRTYNSQSLHDANGDDGGGPSLFGNGWTMTYDAHLVMQSNGDISVYDIDGTRCDYAPQSDGTWKPCTGEHAILEPDPNTPCGYWWIKKGGTAYWFDNPTPGTCFINQGMLGRVYAIYGRNSNNEIALAYSFASGQQPTTENITEVDVNHSNGQSLKMTFAKVGNGSGPNELQQIVLPDEGDVNYSYDASGNLEQVDRTDGNDAAGVLSETYGNQQPLNFACGPRATLSGQTDGACLYFDYNANVDLIDWKVNGILNFDPGDGFGVLQALSTAWKTWYTENFVYGAGSSTPCGTTAANTTTMCDSDGHATIWSLNATSEVTQTQLFTGSQNSLTTAQTWDANRNLTSTTDARGNETDYGYDAMGNTVEVLAPLVSASQLSIRPLSLYSYDNFNNIVAYCDPVSDLQRTPPQQMGDSLCPTTTGSGNFVYKYAYPTQEPYGELTGIWTPCFNSTCQNGGNSTTISYDPGSQGGSVDYGLPTSVIGRPNLQPDGSTRTPEQDFTYGAAGNMLTYVTGKPGAGQGPGGAGTWTIGYSGDHMNRVVTRQDPDGNTSHICYQPDGSVYYTESPYQYHLDGGGICSTTAPPSLATVYSHDTDGDVVKELHHHGGRYTGSLATPAPNPLPTPDLTGRAATTRKFYDGQDRLVEVIQPMDSADVYTNPWITRYLYDLSQSDGAPSLSFQGKSGNFAAYGNLYKTQEILPSATSDILRYGTYATQPISSPLPAATPIVNASVTDINASAFDGADRATAKYRIVATGGKEQLATEAMAYDQSANTQGLLASDCQTSVSECKTYAYDAMGRVTNDGFTLNGQTDPNTPNRDLSYDPDGRTTEIAQEGTNGDTDYYTYDLDGRLTKVGKLSGQNVTYDYYYDGKRYSLGGSLGAGAIKYSYAPDGTLEQLGYNFNPSGESADYGKMAYTLSAGGRIKQRDDYDDGHGPMSQYRKYSDGLLTEADFDCSSPCNAMSTGSHSQMQYSAEGELIGQVIFAPGFVKGSPSGPTPTLYGQVWYYTLRGEIGSQIDGQSASGSPVTTFYRYANGVRVDSHQGPPSPQQGVLTGVMGAWDARMGASTGSGFSIQNHYDQQQIRTLNIQSTGIGYDADGRNTGSGMSKSCVTDDPSIGCTKIPNDTVSWASRSYDVENHVTASAGSVSTDNGTKQTILMQYSWGANGHPKSIASTPNGGTIGSDNVYWDGNTLLYTVLNNSNIDDIKIGADAEFTPRDSAYKAMTFYDRGADGSVAFCHNASGGPGGQGNGDPFTEQFRWSVTTIVNPCGPPPPNANPGWGMTYPVNVAWNGSYNGLPAGAGVGNGWTLAEPRADGITDGVNTIQGVRAYDPIAGQWTTPDAYPGEVHDPSSQKAYMWNGNNPVEYSDPSGYDAIVTVRGGEVTIEIPITFDRTSTHEERQLIKESIQKQWSGQFGGYHVTTTVTSPKAGQVANFVNTNYSGRSDVVGTNRENLNMHDRDAGWTAGHEAGHLMGLGDKYKDQVGKGGYIYSVPLPGYENNVMGSRDATGVKTNQITQIIKSNPTF